MPADFSVNINFDTAQSHIEMKSSEALQGIAQAIVDIARTLSPVRTGRNRDSIDYTVESMAATIFTASGYGGYLEEGTSMMDARPYIIPAIEAVRDSEGGF